MCFINHLRFFGLFTVLMSALWIGSQPADAAEPVRQARTPSLPQNAWSRIRHPLAETPHAVGGYAAGCLVGAMALPLRGEGFQVMRPSRHRYYGHPNLIALIQRLGQQAQAHGIHLLIGDLAQPRGGPMSYGHTSHQNGLDVDIWFAAATEPLSATEVETRPMRAVVREAAGKLDEARWSPHYRDMLYWTARDPAVERIFVNAIIKQALCEREAGQAWLTKIRPWWKHDGHFHVRLHCPPDSPQCIPQPPLPPGDGCDAALADWVRKIQQAAYAPTPTQPGVRKPVTLPETCTAVLQAPDTVNIPIGVR